MRPLHVAALLAVICGVAAWQVTLIPESLMQMAVGATLVPGVVVGGLAVVTLAYGLSAWRGQQVDESLAPEQSPLPGAGLRWAMMMGGAALFMVGIAPLGFVIPATLCGMCIARAFDAPLGLKSALICGAIAVVFWTLFARILGVGLGPALPFGF